MKIILTTLILMISPVCLSASWVEAKDWSGYEFGKSYDYKFKAVPLKININTLEKELWAYIAKNSSSKFEKKDNYTFQYKTINDDEIYINALCDIFDHDPKERIIIIMDGGACYFNVRYNVKNQTFNQLWVNRGA